MTAAAPFQDGGLIVAPASVTAQADHKVRPSDLIQLIIVTIAPFACMHRNSIAGSPERAKACPWYLPRVCLSQSPVRCGWFVFCGRLWHCVVCAGSCAEVNYPPGNIASTDPYYVVEPEPSASRLVAFATACRIIAVCAQATVRRWSVKYTNSCKLLRKTLVSSWAVSTARTCSGCVRACLKIP